jgi:hypothetical protein
MDPMPFLILEIVMAGACGALARVKNRSFAKWAAYGFFAWPIALMHIMRTPRLP